MAGRLTLWGASELLRSFFSRTAEPPPTFYLALLTGPPTAYVSGAELEEPEGVSYSRVALANDALTWSSDGGQLHIIYNTAEAAFVTATEDWGRIAHWALCNADIEGFVYLVGELEEEQVINIDDQVVIDPGDLVVELGPFFSPEEF